MEFFKIILELVQLPAVILGLIALIGLLIQRKPAVDVLTGTIKTVLGLLIMSVGIGALIGAGLANIHHLGDWIPAFPTDTKVIGGCVLLGMGAMFAAVVRCRFTSLIIWGIFK